MIAGMTPSTVKAGFVSAVLDVGFHIELVGGGHYNAAALSGCYMSHEIVERV